MATVDTTIADQVHELVRSMPREKAQSILDYAQYLAERASEERWDELFERSAKSPKFRAWLTRIEEDIKAGKTEPLDLDKL